MQPKSWKYRYIVCTRDDLTGALEASPLVDNNLKQLAHFFWQKIYCRYGAIGQVVTNNGLEVKGAFERLVEKFDIPHVQILPYNKQAGEKVEKGHYTLQEAHPHTKSIISFPQSHYHSHLFPQITIKFGLKPYYHWHNHRIYCLPTPSCRNRNIVHQVETHTALCRDTTLSTLNSVAFFPWWQKKELIHFSCVGWWNGIVIYKHDRHKFASGGTGSGKRTVQGYEEK